MASCGFHSPRFSVDSVWLPPWLQPHRPPILGQSPKDDAVISSPPCKNCAFAVQLQNCENAMMNDGDYSGFRLHLSGDEDTPVVSAPAGGDALLFSLHLSSESIAHLPSAQANYDSHTLNSHRCNGPSDKFSVEVPALQVNTDSKNQLKTKAPESYELVEGCRAPSKEIINPHGKHKHRRDRLSHGKVDIRKLRNADVDDALELSIAASEAMIITEMILHDSGSDHLMAAAAFETALRVKEERKQCCLEDPEYLRGSFVYDLDETEWLAELDESEMVDALEDVGLCLTRTVCSSEDHDTSNLNFKKRQNIQTSCPPCHAQAHILETCSTKKQNEELDSQGANTIDHVSDSLANHDSVWKLQNALSQGFDSVKQTATDKTVSCAKDENVALVQKSSQSIDASAGNMVDLVRSPHIFKEGDGIAMERNDVKRKHARKLFVQETSSISESMNSIEESAFRSRAESNEMIKTSSTSFPCRTKGSCKTNKGSEDEQLHNHFPCSSLSLADPLCSIVPCSISLNEDSLSQVPKCRQTEEEGKELIYPREALGDQIFNEEAAPSCMPSSAQRGKSNLEPRRRKYTSLRPYSTMIPVSKILHKATTNNKPVGSISMVMHTGGICPTSGYSNHFRCEDAEKLQGTCAFNEEDNVIDVAAREHEKCTSLVLDKKKWRVQACNELSNGNGQGGILKEFHPSPENTRHFHVSNEHCKRAKKTPMEPCPQSTVHLHIGKQDVKRKRVQFLEAKHCNKRIKSRRMQPKSRFSRSQSNMIGTLESGEYMDKNEAIFQGLEFLLTGFQGQKEKEIEPLIRKFGGYVLSKVPPSPLDKRSKLSEFARWKPHIVLSPKKASTAKFLYGCATDSWILNPNWLFDSLQAGVLLPPGRYLIQKRLLKQSLRIGEPRLQNHTFIFDGVGFLIHGKISFCSKFSNVIKHGGGQVFISLQGLVQSLKIGSTSKGIILVANEASTSRHLRHCGLEHNIKTVPASWIIGSLLSGKLVPIKKDRCAPFRRIKMPSLPQEQAFEMSQEI